MLLANLTCQKYPEILLQLPSYSGVTVRSRSLEHLPVKETSTDLGFCHRSLPQTTTLSIRFHIRNSIEAFANNDKDTIVNVLEYHILQAPRSPLN